MTEPDPVFLTDTLRDIFSLVPADQSLDLAREVISQYGDRQSSISGSVVWAEFHVDMRFVRAGVSNPRSSETLSILPPADNPIVARIAEYARIHGLMAGMVVPEPSVDGFHWCIPYTAQSRDQAVRSTLRTVLVTKSIFQDIFDLFNLHSQLTPAEKKCVYQLVCGLNPTEAAKEDGVSVETKRSHLKRAMSKLGCNSQSETMRTMISQMIHIMYLCDQDASHSKAIERFTADHLCEPVRLFSLRLPTGRLLRVWDVGPVDGRPILMLHGYLFPFLLLNAQEALERLKVRLVIPVRGGYLDDEESASAFHAGTLVEDTVDDLLAFIRMTWKGQTDVLCHATGAHFGALIAQRDPGVFSKIVVTSLNLMSERSDAASPSASFLGGIRKLARHKGMYRIIVNQFQKRVFSNDRTTKFVLRRLFNECDTDVAALDGHLGNGAAFGWYRALHAHSMIGIASDFALIHNHAQRNISDIGVPSVFLHGPDDRFTTIDEMQVYLANSKKSKLRILQSGGHLAIASHAHAVWDAIADELRLGPD